MTPMSKLQEMIDMVTRVADNKNWQHMTVYNTGHQAKHLVCLDDNIRTDAQRLIEKLQT